MTPRRKAWDYLLDFMEARFASGDIGVDNEAENEEICVAGHDLLADIRQQGLHRLPRRNFSVRP